MALQQGSCGPAKAKCPVNDGLNSLINYLSQYAQLAITATILVTIQLKSAARKVWLLSPCGISRDMFHSRPITHHSLTQVPDEVPALRKTGHLPYY